MYPLIAISVLTLAICLERLIFWVPLRSPARRGVMRRIHDALRKGDARGARSIAEGDGSPFGEVVRALVEGESAALEAVERQRPRLERFLATLSTIITAAPLLGILGTVTGIIQSFNLLEERSNLTEPGQIAGGIAQALLTTAAGLIVALVALFPYMALRHQAARALGVMETLLAAAREGRARGGG